MVLEQVAAILKHIQRYKDLKLLQFRPLPADLFSGATAFQSLSIKFSTLDDLPCLPPSLVQLSLRLVKLRNPLSADSLARASSLRELSLDSVEPLSQLVKLPTSLTSLRLSCLDQLSELPELPSTLEELILDGCYSLLLDPTILPHSLKLLEWEDDGSFDPFTPVSHLTSLTSLCLRTPGAIVNIPCISQLQQLRSLECQSFLQCPSSITSLSTLTSISAMFKDSSSEPPLPLQLLSNLCQASCTFAAPPCIYDCIKSPALP